MRDVLLVVGNGISIDLRCEFPQFHALNSSAPWEWDFMILQGANGIHWRDAFPEFSAYCDKNLESIKGDKFEIFRNIRLSGNTLLRLEARHFLALAFAFYDTQVNPPRSWKWSQLIEKFRGRIFELVSFNYDTNVERALLHSHSLYALNGVHPEHPSVFKPHGCNQIEGAENGIVLQDENGNPHFGYPLRALLEGNDFNSFQRLTYSRTMMPRKESYCILPHEENVFSHFQMQSALWEGIAERYSNVRRCLIIGHSYGAADKPEIDRIINSLPLEAVVHVCNPYPSAELIQFVRSSGRECIVDSGVPEIAP
jgi:hypothetical protein